MRAERLRTSALHLAKRLRGRFPIPQVVLVSLLWISFSYLDINIIVQYTGRVISGVPVETPLFIIYPISFSLMAGTVRWLFLWLAFKRARLWPVLLLVMSVNSIVNWLVLVALSPGWAIPIRVFGFTVAMMTITGGMFGAATGIVLASGIFSADRQQGQMESKAGVVNPAQV